MRSTMIRGNAMIAVHYDRHQLRFSLLRLRLELIYLEHIVVADTTMITAEQNSHSNRDREKRFPSYLHLL